MDFNSKQFPKGDFDIIWASPPCTYYSKLQNTWIGRKRRDGILVTKEWIEQKREESDILMRKVFEIIDYFEPNLWFIENPLSCLKDREVMKDKHMYVCDYCKYSDWGYRKRTCIWTNKLNWKPLVCKNDCENIIKVENQKLHKINMASSKIVEDNGVFLELILPSCGKSIRIILVCR